MRDPAGLMLAGFFVCFGLGCRYPDLFMKLYCDTAKAHNGGVGLILKAVEYPPIHSVFQNGARVDACGTLRAAPSSLSVSASLRLPLRAFAASRDDFHE
jgi:hypothetical protein